MRILVVFGLLTAFSVGFFGAMLTSQPERVEVDQVPIHRFMEPEEVLSRFHLGTVRRDGENVQAYSAAGTAGAGSECFRYDSVERLSGPGSPPRWVAAVCAVTDEAPRSTPRAVPTQ